MYYRASEAQFSLTSHTYIRRSHTRRQINKQSLVCGTEQKATQFALAAAAREKTTREQRKPSVQMPHIQKGIYLC